MLLRGQTPLRPTSNSGLDESTYLTYVPFSTFHALTLGRNQGSNLGTEAKQLPENDPWRTCYKTMFIPTVALPGGTKVNTAEWKQSQPQLH